MNPARGEVSIEIDGDSRPLCLTLGALAELEATFACESLNDLQLRLKRLSATELGTVLQILLRAGGSPDNIDAVRPGDAARVVAEAFHAALG